MFAILWLLFGRVRPAVLGAGLALLNFTVFVQARIAMLDGFMAAFTVLGAGGDAVGDAGAERARRGRAGCWARCCSGWRSGRNGSRRRIIAYRGDRRSWSCAGARRGDGALVRRTRPGKDQRHWPGLAAIPALAALGLVSDRDLFR